MEGDIGNIGSRSIHANYRKLPNKSESNKKETVKPDALHVISDLAKFSCGGFRGLNRSKEYGPKVKNISKRPSKGREIVHAQKFVIVGGRARVRISSGIFLPCAITY